ncbi:MAG: aminotransferase class V-fold PLP-dependent enzyme [Gammaproteobacteria bacterium]|nr:aminotransferase class V-fold PLP-dependent enzyme [Gammaproteobacteria bacterium]
MKSAPWRIGVEAFYEPLEELRRLTGRLINAPADQVAVIPAVSYGIAIAANATQLSREQNVVVPGEEFPSVVYAWRERCRAVGAEMRMVSRPEKHEDQGAAWNQRLLESIDARTGAVALSSVHWTDGTVFDLQAIGARAREVGATFIVDGTQSVGALALDFSSVRPDMLVCAGYKWLMGPYSLGVAVFGERFLGAEPLEHNWIARENSQDFANLVNYRDEFQPGARRFDVGERSNFVLVPMLSKALEQVLEWGPAAVQAYCQQLGKQLEGLLDDSQFRMTAESERAAHLFGIRGVGRATMPSIQKALERRNVYVSLRGDAVRVSPHLYNDESDIAALAEAIMAA